jgi:type I restriction enzyme S subunit
LICVSDYEHKIIANIIKKHAHDCDVLAFGSRYKWTVKDYSDLDLAFVLPNGEKMGLKRIGQLEDAFMESELPYRVDVVDYNGVSDEFRSIIDAGNERVYEGRRGVKLGDVCEIKHGFAFKGEYFCNTPTDYLLVTPGNFAIGGGFQEKVKYYNGVIPKGYMLEKNDLIVTMTDLSKQGDTLGYSALIPQSNRYLHNQRIGLVNITNSCALKEYIYWIMRTRDYQRYIVNHASGSTVKHTAPKTILAYEFDLPSLSEQHTIADTLSALDDKIANNSKINHHLEQMAGAIFKSWFVDFEPTKPFTDIVQVLGGGTPKTGTVKFWDGSIPFFTPKDAFGTYTLTTEKTLTEAGLSNCNSRFYPINTVFVTARGTVGKLALAGRPMAMNQSCYALVGNDGFGQYYIYHLAQFVVEKLKHKASGAVFDAIVTRDFESEIVPVPTVDDVRVFDEKVTPIYEAILNNTKESMRLAALRDILLPRLMSGKLSVADLGGGK